MRINTCFIFISILSGFFSKSIAQATYSSLHSDSLQQDILKLTISYDSLYLCNESSRGKDNLTLTGYGFQNGIPEYVSIQLKRQNGERMEIQKISREKVGRKAKEKLEHMNFGEIILFDDDSLNLHQRKGKNIMAVEDGRYYSLIFLQPGLGSFFLRQSYMPEYFQASVPTADRKNFIDLFHRFEELFD